MYVEEVPSAQTTAVHVFRRSDGREFVPKLDAHRNIGTAIDVARTSAIDHEQEIAEKANARDVCVKLFGADRADNVVAALYSPRMRLLTRRVEVLRAIDKEINGE